MRILPVLASAVVAAAFAFVAAAQPVQPSLGNRLEGTPLAMARMARDAGDAALLEALEGETPVRRDVLAALRASPYASAPEQFVPALCHWAESRDPDLAPLAARVLVDVSEGLAAADFTAREGRVSALREARKALAELMAYAPPPRDDIVFAASVGDAALADLLAQLVPGSS